MLSVRISKELQTRIIHLAEATKRSRSYYVECALKKFLDEQEDYLLALSRLEEKGPNITLKEAKRQLGFDDE
jgi:RHH-type rel operon transcriptional repressor/antitoxin RelB